MTGSDTPASFRLAYVPGVTPAKWVRVWHERLPDHGLTLTQVPAAAAAALVRDRGADAVLLRLPTDRTGLSAIPLYTETTVVVCPKDHELAAADELTVDDVADAVVLHPVDDTLDWVRPPGQPAIHRPATTREAVELVAAGVGLLVVPQSLARLHHRRDLTYRPVAGVPESRVALSWLEDETTDAIDYFIGIVRGRTVNSTRGRPLPAKAAEVRKTAKAKQQNDDRRRGAASRGGRRRPRRRGSA